MDQALGGFASMLLDKMRVVGTVAVPMQEKEVEENLAAQKNSRMYPVVTYGAEEV